MNIEQLSEGRLIKIKPHPEKPHQGERFGMVLGVEERRTGLEPVCRVQVYYGNDPNKPHQVVRYRHDRIMAASDEELAYWIMIH